MITLYTAATGNGRRPAIALAELGLHYNLHKVDMPKGEHKRSTFLALNPSGKIPVMVDEEDPIAPVVINDSSAMLLYLAEKFGALLPQDPRERWNCITWVFWQACGMSPAFSQWRWFTVVAPQRNEAAIARLRAEVQRELCLLNERLGEVLYLSGEYSIADIANYPYLAGLQAMDLSIEDYPNLARWADRVGQRPAVQRGMALAA